MEGLVDKAVAAPIALRVAPEVRLVGRPFRPLLKAQIVLPEVAASPE